MFPLKIRPLAAICLHLWLARAGAEPNPAAPPAPGYAPLIYQPAHAGAYRLQVLGSAADGQVLTSDNQTARLKELMQGKITLLNFIYTSCGDVNGCPLATHVLHKLSLRLAERADLKNQVRFLTLSFSPRYDTPQILKQYAASISPQPVDWRFLTTQSESELQNVLDAYNQPVTPVYDAQGRFTGTYQHLLRVYLIDAERRIRNIYSTDFLHVDTLYNDIVTLAGETPAAPAASAGHADLGYLLRNAQQPPLGLPRLTFPNDNPITAAKIALGRRLFFDRRLSFNQTVSCAICHVPEQGYANNEMATAVGVEGRSVRRNSPTLFNVGQAELLFHDGREHTLEQQAWGPLLAANEMGNPSIGFVLDNINRQPEYRKLFQLAFGKPADMLTLGQALASYQRSLNAAGSPFDLWYFRGQTEAISPEAQRGFALFIGRAGCAACHTIKADHALFSDQQRHNTGIGYRAAMQGNPPPQVTLVPGQAAEISPELWRALNPAKPNDLGYYEISQNPADRWAYKTPTLRNVALTAPYMHDGSIPSLKEVLRFYNQGGAPNENLSPKIKPLGLTETELDYLEAFLLTLTGANVQVLINDAAAAPRGERE